MTYFAKDNNELLITVEESIKASHFIPASGSVYLDINGTEVLEQASEATLIYVGGERVIKQLIYTWNLNGVYFDVRITGYSQEFSQRVIESMVRQ